MDNIHAASRIDGPGSGGLPNNSSLPAASKDSKGKLIEVNVKDPDADALAQRIGGEPRVRFELDPVGREFDAVSDKFVAQAKPANFQMGKKFRNQAKATFEMAISTGRRPYFHFDGPPQAGVIEKLKEYGSRYGVEPVIDLKKLK